MLTLRLRPLVPALLCGLLGFGLLSCAGERVAGPDTGSKGGPSTVATPAGNGQTGPVGQALPTALVVQVTTAGGTPVSGAAVTWAVQQGGGLLAEAGTATDKSGRASAKWTLGGTAGNQSVAVTAGGLTTVFLATATAGAPVRVEATPRAFTARSLGDTVRVLGRPLDAYGNIAGQLPVTFESRDPALGTVDAGGLVTARAPGRVFVLVRAGTAVDSLALQVDPIATRVALSQATATLMAGDTATLLATAYDARGNAIPGRTATWFSSNPAVVDVAAGGQLVGRAAGTATVTATVGGVSGSATVTVTQQPVASLAVTPAAASVLAGRTTTLTAQPRDARGTLLPGRIIAWRSSAPGVATVSAAGVVTGVATGTATITAESEGQMGTATITVTVAPVDRLTLALNAASVTAGGGTQAVATAYAADGSVLTGRSVSYATSNAAVATVSAAGYVTAVAAGTATITATCEGKSASAALTVGAAPVATVVVSPAAASLAVSDSVRLTATPQNAAGGVVGGKTILWTSSAAGIATVSVTGVVKAVAAGTATITATTDGKSGTATITVTVAPPTAVATVAVSPATASVGLGATQQFLASVKAADGTVLTGRAVTWTSSAPGVATIAANGLATAVAAGTTTITASVDGKAGTAMLTVTAPATTAITRLAPDTLVPGGIVTITGTNLPTAPSVTVGGVAATVTSASATQIVATLAAPASYGCQATQGVPVSVAGTGGSAAKAWLLRTATVRSLARGASLTLLDPTAARCLELPATGGKYGIAIVNTNAQAVLTRSAELRGTLGLPLAASPSLAGLTAAQADALRRPAPPRAAALRVVPRTTRLLGAGVATDAAGDSHEQILDANLALLRRLGRPTSRARRAAGATVQTAAPTLAGLAAVGDTARLHFPSPSSLCTIGRELTLRTVYVGTKAIVLEDVTNAGAGTFDADYQAIGQTFDQTQYPLLTANFADPLAYDAALGGPGKVTMVFTNAVTGTGLAGFVSSGDFYPSAQCAASNGREVFYAGPPAAGNGANWRRAMHGTVMHESKHIASFAERFARPGAYEDSWLEEATAQIASELFARSVYGYAQFGNVTYAQSLLCEVSPTAAGCNGRAMGALNPFSWFRSYLLSVETKSGIDNTDNVKYGAGWMLARYAADQSGQGEAAFFRALTTEKSLVGTANLTARAGQPFATLLTDFAAALVADDYPGTTILNARHTLPSWNVRDVATNLWGNYPLASRAAAGNFTASIPTIGGGTAAFVELTASPTVPQLLELRGPAGATLGDGLTVAIVRLQ